MTRYLAIVNQGLVENVILGNPESFPSAIDITDVNPRPGPGWVYLAGQFAPPAPADEPELPRHITRLAFRKRLTSQERVSLDLAGETPVYRDEEHAEESRSDFQTRRINAATFRDLQQQVSDANYIDLDRSDTREAVQLLETLGLLASGRALEILDAPIDPMERPL